jgi:hypothetical protein
MYIGVFCLTLSCAILFWSWVTHRRRSDRQSFRSGLPRAAFAQNVLANNILNTLAAFLDGCRDFLSPIRIADFTPRRWS